MPSPVGHIIAGVATGWVAQSWPGASRARRAAAAWLPAVCAGLAILPDADLLLAAHRTWTHSIGAVAATGLAAAAIARWRRWPVVAGALMAAAALGSHVLLDWLGSDPSAPVGIMALWPVSEAYYVSGMDLFMEVSRRYWIPDEIVVHNLKAAVLEAAILGPVAVAARWWRDRARSRLKLPRHDATMLTRASRQIPGA